MSEIKEGQFYVYRDEDGNAVSIAMMSKGPNGGHMGVGYASMGIPYGKTTWEDINNRAEFMAAAMNSFGNAKAVIAAKEAEIAKLRWALQAVEAYDSMPGTEFAKAFPELSQQLDDIDDAEECLDVIFSVARDALAKAEGRS